jgi:hypothetical protein
MLKKKAKDTTKKTLRPVSEEEARKIAQEAGKG